MKIVVASVAVSALFAFQGAPERSAEQIEKDRVYFSFNTFKKAVSNHRGQNAVAMLCESTLDYFDRVRELALYGTKEELDAQPLINRMQILTFRHRVSADQLQTMPTPELLAHAFDQGWMMRNVMRHMGIGAVSVDGSRAFGDVRAAGEPVKGKKLLFCKESDKWRFDLLMIIDHSGEQLEGLVRYQDQEENELLMALLTRTSRVIVPETIWNPPFQKP